MRQAPSAAGALRQGARYRAIDVRRAEGRPAVARLTLGRPEVGNAMDDRFLRELADAFRRLARESDLRAVVIAAEGRHFCTGADIEWMRRAGRLTAARSRRDAALLLDMVRAVDGCPVPVVARLHGCVFGGGLGLAAASDVVLAADDARFCFSECRLGIAPAVISTVVLPRIGAAAARRFYLTAEVFGAAEARRLGLAGETAPAAELDALLGRVLDSILMNGPAAVRAAKDMVRRMAGLDFAARGRLALDVLVRLRSSSEGQEGLAAFLEKRRPAWAP